MLNITGWSNQCGPYNNRTLSLWPTGPARERTGNERSRLGAFPSFAYSEVGLLTFVYATDPEGNIIELQSWK